MSTTSTNSRPTLLERRARNSVPLAPELTKEARRVATAILEVLAGARTPQQAADALQMSLQRYYQVESRGLHGLLEACVPKPKGRQPDPAGEARALRRHNEQLQRELARQQTLVRMAQRTIGLNPPPAPTAKANGKKSRKRKPAARALTLAKRLKQEASPAEMPVENAMPAAKDGAMTTTIE